MGRSGTVLIAAMALIVIAASFWDQLERRTLNVSRCEAAQQTIVEEAELIEAAGKFPEKQVTDRWKKLMEGC